jgi:hypothetical protein
MEWPWAIYTLSDAEKLSRRRALDAYGSYAQLSALLPITLLLLLKLVKWIGTAKDVQGAYAAVPHSPALKSMRARAKSRWQATFRRFFWWLQDEVRIGDKSYGQRDQWFAGVGWTMWLVFLCIYGTGRGESLLAMLTSINVQRFG